MQIRENIFLQYMYLEALYYLCLQLSLGKIVNTVLRI